MDRPATPTPVRTGRLHPLNLDRPGTDTGPAQAGSAHPARTPLRSLHRVRMVPRDGRGAAPARP
ncbi:hypothetical protein NE236_42740 [Actinoallomurus purpureus]|uniref:hypothetical protein n=1 Tax=Actinoallomurus purpureus TaxID=478114 RepID=UPI002092EB64|nr:hypothetical protein [Actinoallomurus purpureus]MCO6011684.1 hypothetical protein [Actinoallomurus purpureus]